MSAVIIADWALTWDSEPSRPQLPVRCLEGELAPSSITAQRLAAEAEARAAQKSRADGERSRKQRRKDLDSARKSRALIRRGAHE